MRGTLYNTEVAYLFITSVFILGTIIGSFLNVVINRYGKESIQGRSHCESCARTLSPSELVPVASFFLFRGRCAGCKTPISFQYVFVELLTGALFLLSFIAFGFSFEFVFSIIIWSFLVVIAVYDFKHTIIPDEIVFSFIVVTFIRIIFLYGIRGLFIGGGLPYVLAGILFFIPFFLLWYLSKGTWMGLGDGKLVIGIGFLLGLERGISALLFAFWIGALISVFLLFMSRYLKLKFKGKSLTIKSEIPFGPFLILGTGLVYFFDFNILTFLLS